MAVLPASLHEALPSPAPSYSTLLDQKGFTSAPAFGPASVLSIESLDLLDAEGLVLVVLPGLDAVELCSEALLGLEAVELGSLSTRGSSSMPGLRALGDASLVLDELLADLAVDASLVDALSGHLPSEPPGRHRPLSTHPSQDLLPRPRPVPGSPRLPCQGLPGRTAAVSSRPCARAAWAHNLQTSQGAFSSFKALKGLRESVHPHVQLVGQTSHAYKIYYNTYIYTPVHMPSSKRLQRGVGPNQTREAQGKSRGALFGQINTQKAQAKSELQQKL